jgi:chromosome segregation ATPase
MPAAKINRDEVAEAIRILQNQGIPDPGVHRLRRFLGRGSVTTVARFKNELRQIELERLSPDKKRPLPDPVTELAQRLWEELLAAVEGVEQQVHETAEQRLDEKQQQLDRIEAERNQVQQDNLKLIQELATVRELAEKQREQCHDLETTVSELNGRLSSHAALIEALRGREQDLKAAMAESATRSAKREKTLTDQLSEERQRSFNAQQDAAQQRQELEAQLQVLRENLAGQREHYERLKISLQQETQQLEKKLSARDQALEDLRTEYAGLCTKHDTLRQGLGEVEKKLVRANAQLSAKEQAIEAITTRLNEIQGFHQEVKANHEQVIMQLKARLARKDPSSPQ